MTSDDPAAHAQAKRVVAAGYDRMARRYAAWASGIDDQARRRMTAELVGRLREGAAVLDLGCGSGVPSTAALAQRFIVTGVDISASQIALAQRQVPGATFLISDMTRVELPPSSFEAVTAFYSITHVPREEHAALFRNVSRWLKPGGHFLAALTAAADPGWYGEWMGEPMFFSGFDAETNAMMLRDLGLSLVMDEIIEMQEPEGTVPFQWVLARKPTADGPAAAGEPAAAGSPAAPRTRSSGDK
jgi:ubiquinone/menaquinone biosynthesis C-methylase UbiE